MLETGDPLGATLEQILRNISPQVAEALQLCAIPRWFDQAMIAALREEALHSDKILTRLQRFTFLEPLSDGRYALHENVRALLLARWEPQQLRNLHERAYMEYGRRLENGLSLHQQQLELERIYHQLAFAPDEALGLVQALFQEAENSYALEICEALVGILQQQSDASLQDWGSYYQCRIELLNRRTESAAHLLAPLTAKLAQLDEPLRARVQFTFASVESLKGHWQAAIECYQKSYAYFRRIGQDDIAGTIALEIAETYTNYSIYTQFTTYKIYKQTNFRAAIFFQRLMLWPISLYLTWLLTGTPFGFGPGYSAFHTFEPLHQAVKWYRAALDLAKDPQLIFTIKLAIIRLLSTTGNFKGSLAMGRALQTSPVTQTNLYQKALLHRASANSFLLNGVLPEAEKEISAGLEIFRTYGDKLYEAGALNIRGLTYLLQEKRELARADYQECIGILRALNNKLYLGRVRQQLSDLDEALLEELDLNEADRIFISQGQHRNQRLISIIWVILLIIVVNITAVITVSRVPLALYIISLIGALWISIILILPIARLLMPLPKLRQLQSTFVLLSEEKITQLRMDETVRAEIRFREIDAVTLNQAAYWKNPLPRGAWLQINAAPNREIRINQGIDPGFQSLVAKLKTRLADKDVHWVTQTRAYLRDARYYILAVLYFGVLIFGTELFAEAIFSPEESSRENMTILLTLVSLLLFFQFAPDLESVFRSGRRHRFSLILMGVIILPFACYLAWQNSPAVGVIVSVLGFGLVVQTVLWIIRLVEGLVNKV